MGPRGHRKGYRICLGDAVPPGSFRCSPIHIVSGCKIRRDKMFVLIVVIAYIYGFVGSNTGY